MSYPSVDKLQQVLAKDVFHYAKDAKKASGRALGTLVELITFYSLKSWGLEQQIAIERPLSEFANPGITHNVEYSLHPLESAQHLKFRDDKLPLTAAKILKHPALAGSIFAAETPKSSSLLTANFLLRNACTIAETKSQFLNAYLSGHTASQSNLTVAALRRQPFAIVECKRVGVEEGMKKGPQTIEKAKQGAYVARTVSSLQKIRLADGQMGGLIAKADGSIEFREYYSLLAEVIKSNKPEHLSKFILTIGVVSNHGNWFTSENHNKELKVLAQSYDWLLFLTDLGIAQFIKEVLLSPKAEFGAARKAFLASYKGKKGENQFTKVRIALDADAALQKYFSSRRKVVEGWFNVIAPAKGDLEDLKSNLAELKAKNWKVIHS